LFASVILGLIFLPMSILNTFIWRSLFRIWGRPWQQGALPFIIQTALLAAGIGFLNFGQYGVLISMFFIAGAFFFATPKIVPIARAEIVAQDITFSDKIGVILRLSCWPVLGPLYSVLLIRELAKHQGRDSDNLNSGTSVDDSKEHL
jgi:hypothetical protein